MKMKFIHKVDIKEQLILCANLPSENSVDSLRQRCYSYLHLVHVTDETIKREGRMKSTWHDNDFSSGTYS